MAVTKDNRTLAILNAAAKGNYGVMAAIAYEATVNVTHNSDCLQLQRWAIDSPRSRGGIEAIALDNSAVPIDPQATAPSRSCGCACRENRNSTSIFTHRPRAECGAHPRDHRDATGRLSHGRHVALRWSRESREDSDTDQGVSWQRHRCRSRERADRRWRRWYRRYRRSWRYAVRLTTIINFLRFWLCAALFTSPEDVDNFINAGIDILAPSIGNVHGDYGPAGPKEGQLHYDRLEAIDKQINKRVLVALHGTNDFPAEVMQRCIRSGAIKLNVNKLLLEVGNEVLRKHAPTTSLAKLIDMQIEVIQKETERWMDICGSSGKAWKGNRPMTQQHCTVISTEHILLLYCTTAWCFQTRLIATRANVVLFLSFCVYYSMLRCAVELSIQCLENGSNDQLSLQLLHATKTLVLIDLYARL